MAGELEQRPGIPKSRDEVRFSGHVRKSDSPSASNGIFQTVSIQLQRCRIPALSSIFGISSASRGKAFDKIHCTCDAMQAVLHCAHLPPLSYLVRQSVSLVVCKQRVSSLGFSQIHPNTKALPMFSLVSRLRALIASESRLPRLQSSAQHVEITSLMIV